MKLLVTGGRGQLGRSVAARAARDGHAVIALDVDALDICDPDAVARAVAEVDVVINTAAYTAVDKAEIEQERAFAVNRDGARTVASACANRGKRLLHLSTDYVFAGTGERPYRESDPVAPLGVYGESKLDGEQAVHSFGGTVVRTSWLFGEGGPSFVHTMLRLARERPVLRVVADQRGCPTYTGDLAGALLALAVQPVLDATYHACNEGATSWHALAEATVNEARRHTTPTCERIDAITTAEYPTPARRPAYSVLDTSRLGSLGITFPTWHAGLARVVAHALTET